MKIKLVAILLFWSASLGAVMGNPLGVGDHWYLESNMLSLDSSNRYIGVLAATNSSSTTKFLRVSVNQVMLKDGVRTRRNDEAGVLKVFPSEFVLRPKETFRVRLLGDAGKLISGNASYYVKFEDVSRLKLDATNIDGAGAGFLVAYEALVNMSTEPAETLTNKDFIVSRLPSGRLEITNASKRHVYLERGNACPEVATMLVECDAIADFPKQSMLPGETLLFNPVAKPYLVMLVQPKLNSRIRATRIALPLPR